MKHGLVTHASIQLFSTTASWTRCSYPLSPMQPVSPNRSLLYRRCSQRSDTSRAPPDHSDRNAVACRFAQGLRQTVNLLRKAALVMLMSRSNHQFCKRNAWKSFFLYHPDYVLHILCPSVALLRSPHGRWRPRRVWAAAPTALFASAALPHDQPRAARAHVRARCSLSSSPAPPSSWSV